MYRCHNLQLIHLQRIHVLPCLVSHCWTHLSPIPSYYSDLYIMIQSFLSKGY